MKKESEILFKSIENIIERKMKSISYDKKGTVLEVNEDFCTVSIDNEKYKIKNGIGVQFFVGDKCLVHYINGSQKNKIIIAKL